MPQTWPAYTVRSLQTCDDMNGKTFALSITDAFNAEMVSQRLEHIIPLASEFPNLKTICIRDDMRSAERLKETAELVRTHWNGDMIIDSPLGTNLETAISDMDPDGLILTTSDSGWENVLLPLAKNRGCRIIVQGEDVQQLMDRSEHANAEGIEFMIMPGCRNMKQTLETFTDIGRIRKEHGIEEAKKPSCLKVWSGEYAIAVATVAFSRGCNLLIFDHLERDGCMVINTICTIQQPDIF